MIRQVAPRDTRPVRLGRLARLPVFLDLRGRRVLLAGGGEPAAWKAELLAAAGARVDVVATEFCDDLVALADCEPAINLVAREVAPDDLADAALAIGEIKDDGDALAFAEAARARGVLVNVIDRPAACDFQFGAIVNRSPVVVAITTDGAAPILGQAIRRRIEAVLPAGLGDWAAAAARFRRRLAEILPDKGARRAFWERFVDLAFAGTAGGDDALPRLERLARDVGGRAQGRSGEVVLVGAGPGDASLMTLAGMRALQAADVIVYDRLVGADVLELGRREARRILVGKEGHGAFCRQDEINALIVELARGGARVVRLKGGDPAIFGRAGEEIAACRAAGIAVSMIPGVTAASAAAAALGASLTHRDHARRVQFVTGHDRDGALPPDLDFAALADPRATTCVYMPKRTIRALANALLARGLPAGTPAILARDVSRPGAEYRRVTLAELAEEGQAPDSGGATLVLIGHALAEDRTRMDAAPGEASAAA